MPLQPLRDVASVEASEARFWHDLGHGAAGGLLIGAVLGTAFMAMAMLFGGIPIDPGEIAAGTTSGAFGGIFFGAFARLILGGGMQN